MKWLFAILVALNLIVFAGMISVKLLNKHMPAAAQVAPAPVAPQQPPAQVIINTGNGAATTTTTAATNPSVAGSNANNAVKRPTPVATTPKSQNNNARLADDSGSARVQYKACSARVSMPEDDYHRIKGLLSSYPHAATRQVVESAGGESGQTASRMNVLFMSLDDQQAAAVQGVVGRYGQLNRAACNK